MDTTAVLGATGTIGPVHLHESAHRLFEGGLHAAVTTVNRDGSPQTSLVWMRLEDDRLVFGAEDHRLKVRNLRRDPRVTVLVQDDRDHAIGLRQHLTVTGTAAIEGPDIAERYTELMDDLARRYLGTDVYPMPNRGSATAVIVRITPHRVGGLGPWAEPGR